MQFNPQGAYPYPPGQPQPTSWLQRILAGQAGGMPKLPTGTMTYGATAGTPGFGTNVAQGTGVPTVITMPPPDAQPARPLVTQPNSADEALAKALLGSANDGGPIETGMELLGRTAQSFVGNKLQRDYQDASQHKYDSLIDALTGNAPSGVSDPVMSTILENARGNPELATLAIQRWMNPPKSAQDDYGFATMPDGTVLRTNKRTGAVEPAYAGAPKASFRPLITPEERRAAGIADTDKTPYQIGIDGKVSQIGTAGTVVNIDQKGETEEAKARGKAVASHFEDIAKDLPAADSLVQAANQIDNLLATTETGAIPSLLENIRKTTGIAIGDNADKRQALESMVDYLTPRMRVPGSGATSDMEMRTFKNSLPTLLGTKEGNAIISATMRGLAQRRLDMARIAEDYLYGGIDAAGAAKKMRELPDPFADFKKVNAAKEGGASGAPAAPAPPAPAEKPPVDGARKAPDGKWYVPDPNRPGGYLRVE